MDPIIYYIVPASFKEIDTLKGRFILHGNDSSALLAQQSAHGDTVVGLILTGPGPFKAISPLPGCELILDLDHASTPAVADILDSLDPAAIRFSVTQASTALPTAIQLSKFPVELDLALSLEHLERCQLEQLLTLYLHEPANRLKLQPLHTILEALLYKRTIRLWDLLWADPTHWRHISGQELIHPRGNGTLVPIGSYRDGRCRFSAEGRRLIKLSRHSFAENPSCQQCPFYFICGGCIRALYDRCDNWFYLLDQLQQAARQLVTTKGLSPKNKGAGTA